MDLFQRISKRISCPGCHVRQWEKSTVRNHVKCGRCGDSYNMFELDKLIPKRRPKRSRGQRMASKQEKRLAKDRGGARRTQASGSNPHDPSDVEEKGYRFECKATDARRIILTEEVLRKIAGEAIPRGQVPVLQIEFASSGELYAVLRWTDFQALTNGV